MYLDNTVTFTSTYIASATVIANDIDIAATILTFWTTVTVAVTSHYKR